VSQRLVRSQVSDSWASASWTRFLLAQWLSAVLAVAVYAPALEGPFVWDDRLLLETAQVAELRPLAEYFSQPFWQVPDDEGSPRARRGAYYRPLATMSLAIDRKVHGDNAAGFHLLGLLLHGLNTALVLGLARRLGASVPAALVGALLFAWFPRSTEAVAWISGRTDVLATTFSLLALGLTLGPLPARRWLAAGCILLGAFSKEVALAAAIGVLAWEWAGSSALPTRERWLRLLPTGAACLTYIALRTWVLGGTSGQSEITVATRSLASLEAVSRYAILLVDAWQPRLQIGYLARPDPWLAALGVVLLPLPFLAMRKMRAEVPQVALLLVFFVALGLVLHVVPIQGRVVAADRFLYLPVAVLGALAASWIAKAPGFLPLAAASVLALSYAPVTWARAGVWGDDIAFWGTAVQERSSGLNAHARLGFGNLLAEHGMYEEALRQYEQAEPGDAHSWMLCQYNRAGLLAQNGQFDAAISVLEAANRQAPNPTQLKRLALLNASALRADRARELARQYGERVADLGVARELEVEVSRILSLMPELARPPTNLSQELAQARGYAEVGLYRLAIAKLLGLMGQPGITPEHLQGMLSSALQYGTPEQLEAVEARLHAVGAASPPAYAVLLAERSVRVRRLRDWVQASSRDD
jgi:tetratricopeptide (TPR) repeat protein